jgi:excisionase family DNA binding protein
MSRPVSADNTKWGNGDDRERKRTTEMARKGAAKTPHYTGPIRVMTVRELSEYLRVHPSTIYRLLRRNQIPAFRMGSDWRFNIEAIDRWRLERDKPGG